MYDLYTRLYTYTYTHLHTYFPANVYTFSHIPVDMFIFFHRHLNTFNNVFIHNTLHADIRILTYIQYVVSVSNCMCMYVLKCARILFVWLRAVSAFVSVCICISA